MILFNILKHNFYKNMKIKEKVFSVFKNKKFLLSFLIIILVICGFYWFYIRSLNIKAKCKNTSIESARVWADKTYNNTLNEFLSVEKFYYQNCLIKNKVDMN